MLFIFFQKIMKKIINKNLIKTIFYLQMDANLQFTIYNVKWLVCSGSRLDEIDSQWANEFAGLNVAKFGRTQQEPTGRAARAVDHLTGLPLHRVVGHNRPPN